jgi:hypothetical protein
VDKTETEREKKSEFNAMLYLKVSNRGNNEEEEEEDGSSYDGYHL